MTIGNRHKYYYILTGFILAGGLYYLLNTFVFVNGVKADGKVNDDFPQGYKIISPYMPAQMEFAGENVPLNNYEVKERLDRELLVNTYWHSFTLLSIKRANRWFPVIEPILIRNNIPDDFKYVALIESGLANVISPAGATGFWQFLEKTAKEYGLTVNKEVDERYHVEKSTEAACRYLQKAYDLFGSWTVAAASYNMGIDGVAKQLERQRTKNYYNLVLGEETSRYMARILSVKLILTNPKRYGYELKDEDLYPPLQTKDMLVDSSINDLALFAINNGYNYKILKMYNPWLRDVTLTNKNRVQYYFKFPEEGSIEMIKE
ncbi:MAG: lytic transglycosylase domain-containing protein [Ignavibacteriales bacterium]|nr:MAG: lytic transglycosylase domain-containing protein [Ignavibacteriales bacterium]